MGIGLTWRSYVVHSIRACISLMVAVAALGSPNEAAAGVARLVLNSADDGAVLARLSYAARPGEENQVSVGAETTTAGEAVYVVRDRAGASAGRGCVVGPHRRGVRCAIPQGARPVGPVVALGNRHDAVYVNSDAGGARLIGGSGNDYLSSYGWSLVLPGSGSDEVNVGSGGGVVRARDGSADRITCDSGVETLFMDGWDFAEPGSISDGRCASIHRRGQPRALAIYADVTEDGYFRIWIGCPSDGPGVCAGIMRLFDGPRLLERERFRVRRGRDVSTSFNAGARRLRGVIRRGVADVRVSTFIGRGRTLEARTLLGIIVPCCGESP